MAIHMGYDFFKDNIGAYVQDARTGKWSIIGASQKMSEAFDDKMKANTYRWDDVCQNAVLLDIKGEAIDMENYFDFKKPTGTMPKHCYGTTFGYKQSEDIKLKLKDYYVNKTGSLEELKEFFKDCCKDMRVILAQDRKTTGLNENDNKQIILDTYEQFRMLNSIMANAGCYEEGKKVALENGWDGITDLDWVYYNADYHYSSEELRAAFKEAANELAQEWNISDMDVSQRDTDSSLSYSSSFHEVWNHGSENGVRICHFSDINRQPPADFRLFYREHIDKSGDTGILKVGISGKFDISKTFIFALFNSSSSPYPQFYHLSELLVNELKQHDYPGFPEFIDNFSIYTRYYGTSSILSQ